MLREGFLDGASVVFILIAMVAWWRVLTIRRITSATWAVTLSERADITESEWAWHAVGWLSLTFAAMFGLLDLFID